MSKLQEVQDAPFLEVSTGAVQGMAKGGKPLPLAATPEEASAASKFLARTAAFLNHCRKALGTMLPDGSKVVQVAYNINGNTMLTLASKAECKGFTKVVQAAGYNKNDAFVLEFRQTPGTTPDNATWQVVARLKAKKFSPRVTPSYAGMLGQFK